MSESKEKLSPRAQLYLRYRDEIEQVRKAYEEDMDKITSCRDLVDDLLPIGNWKFKTHSRLQQLYKDSWRKKGAYFVHYEVFLNEDDISKQRFRFMLEVERSRKKRNSEWNGQ